MLGVNSREMFWAYDFPNTTLKVYVSDRAAGGVRLKLQKLSQSESDSSQSGRCDAYMSRFGFRSMGMVD